MLGHASVVSIPKDFPMTEYIHHLFEFSAEESCGKCFPGRLGSYRGKEMFDQFKNKTAKKALQEAILWKTGMKSFWEYLFKRKLRTPVSKAFNFWGIAKW